MEYDAQWSHDARHIFYLRREWGGIPRTHEVERTFTYKFRDHRAFAGTLNADIEVCVQEAPVKLRYRPSPDKPWRTIVDFQTNSSGGFKWPLPDRAGEYRMVAPERTIPYQYDNAHCLRTLGPLLRHRH
jgi:hypothetical protein